MTQHSLIYTPKAILVRDNPLYSHHVRTIYPLSTHRLPIMYPLSTHCLLTVYLSSTLHPCYIHGTSMEHPWNIHGTSMEHPWNIHGTSMEHPWNIHPPPCCETFLLQSENGFNSVQDVRKCSLCSKTFTMFENVQNRQKVIKCDQMWRRRYLSLDFDFPLP